MGSFLFFKQETAYEMRISDCSSDVCASDLCPSVALFTRCHVLRTLGPVRNMEVHHRGDMLATQNEDTYLLRPSGIYPTDLSRKTGAGEGIRTLDPNIGTKNERL